MIKINENLFVPAAPFGFSPRFPTGKKGYIQKRGHYIKNWKMRFFVLEKMDDELKIKKNFIIQYYTDEKCGKLKGSYIINEDTVIESLAEFDGKGNVISVTSKKSNGDLECLYLSMGTEEERTQWFNAFREAMHGGFRSIVMTEIATASFYPTHGLVVKYKKDNDSTANDIPVLDGNILLARELHLRPKISYGNDHGYYTLLLVDIDFPSRAASPRKFCIYWALVNICKSDRTCIKEVAPYLPPAPFHGTGLHRYYFLLFAQSHMLDNAEVESSANWFTPREGFPYPQWKASMGYTIPAGINGFYAEWEECCDLYHKSCRCLPPDLFMSPRQKEVARQALAQGLQHTPQGMQSPRADEDDDDDDSDEEDEDEEEKAATVTTTSSSKVPEAVAAKALPAQPATAVAAKPAVTATTAPRSRISKRSRAVVGLKMSKAVDKKADSSIKSASSDLPPETEPGIEPEPEESPEPDENPEPEELDSKPSSEPSSSTNTSSPAPVASPSKASSESSKAAKHARARAAPTPPPSSAPAPTAGTLSAVVTILGPGPAPSTATITAEDAPIDNESAEDAVTVHNLKHSTVRYAEPPVSELSKQALPSLPPPRPRPKKPEELRPIDAYLAALQGSSEGLGSLSIDNTARPKFKLPFDPEKRFKKLHKEIKKKSVMFEPSLKAFLDDD